MNNNFKVLFSKPYIKLPLIYFIISFIWIIASDYILFFVKIPWHSTELVAMLKGTFFITSTTLLIYFLAKKDFLRITDNNNKLNLALNQYMVLINNFPNPIFRTDINGKCDFFNEAWFRFGGRPLTKEMGSGWIDSIHPDEKNNVLKIYTEAVGNREKFILKFRLKHNDGSYHWVLLYGSPFYVLEKEFNGYIGSCYDIDAQVKIESTIVEMNEQLESKIIERTRELNIALKKLQSEIEEKNKMQQEILKNADEISDLYDNSPCGYHSLDKNGVFVKINKKELEWLGYSEDEIINKMKFTDIITEESKTVFLNNFPKFLSDGYINDLEFDLVNKNGTITSVLLKATSIKDADGSFLKSRSSIFDITELKKAREDLKTNSLRLEEANKELESFSYSVSHDLRAPLRAVSGFSKILYDDYYTNLDISGKELLTDIISNIDKMAQLIDDLLAFSRIGRKEISKSEVNMTELFQTVFLEMQPDLSGRTIEFNLLKLFNVYADYNLLKQVIFNLMSNALKFTRKNQVTLVEVGSRKDGDNYLYWIKDNGVGFNMKYADKLFGVFQRLHSETEFEGTGVGLAIVQRIILKHGGTIRVESSIGNGSTFYFSLPAEKSDNINDSGVF